MEKWIIALLVLSNLYFAWRWRISELSAEGFAFYIVKKRIHSANKKGVA